MEPPHSFTTQFESLCQIVPPYMEDVLQTILLTLQEEVFPGMEITFYSEMTNGLIPVHLSFCNVQCIAKPRRTVFKFKIRNLFHVTMLLHDLQLHTGVPLAKYQEMAQMVQVRHLRQIKRAFQAFGFF